MTNNSQDQEQPKEQEPKKGETQATPPPKEVTISEAELEKLKNELAEYKDKYLRQLAEVENARKRLQKERQELTQYAVEQIIADFLQPLDNLENALRFAEQLSGEMKNWVSGFQMILIQFKDILANQGVTAIHSVGKPFDPTQHEAVESIETTEATPGTVIEECMRGYKIGERTIRPARVKVAKAKESNKK